MERYMATLPSRFWGWLLGLGLDRMALRGLAGRAGGKAGTGADK